ncbi:MAG TPA: response regulator [Ktedonobacteraceae bacterium]|nr:response regulator [Ktedonobacteraceae bacterium]
MMQAHGEQTSHGPFTAKMILVVEDDAMIAEMLLHILRQETPYQALHAADGRQALQITSLLRPDLCLLDYRLPGMNGLELYDRMQQVEALKQIPTIFMSAYLPQEEVKTRPVALLHKPFELDELLETIEHLLALENF